MRSEERRAQNSEVKRERERKKKKRETEKKQRRTKQHSPVFENEIESAQRA